MKKLNEKTQSRFYDYVLIYANTIWEYWEELQRVSKRKRSGDVTVNWKKHIYFGSTNGITIMDKKTNLEMTFTFNFEKDNVFFIKSSLYSFIESDLNLSWLGKYFIANRMLREDEYDQCIEALCESWELIKKDKWYLISKEELY